MYIIYILEIGMDHDGSKHRNTVHPRALSGLPPTLNATSLFTAGVPPKVNGLHSRMFSFWRAGLCGRAFVRPCRAHVAAGEARDPLVKAAVGEIAAPGHRSLKKQKTPRGFL